MVRIERLNCLDLPSGSDDECDLRFGFNVVAALCLGFALQVNDLLLCFVVFFEVLLGVGCVDFSLFGSLFFGCFAFIFQGLENFGITILLLDEVFWDDSVRRISN